MLDADVNLFWLTKIEDTYGFLLTLISNLANEKFTKYFNPKNDQKILLVNSDATVINTN